MENQKFIKVYDDLLNPILVDKVEELLLKNNPPIIKYDYVQNITHKKSGNNDFSPGLSYNFLEPEVNNYNQTHFLLSNILYNFASCINIQIIKIILGRSFLQLPLPNPPQNNIHIDLPYPHWVCLYYVTDSDGDTILFDEDEKEIKRVTPKKGRIVFFDGSIKHCSSHPSKTHRSIINFDFTTK